MGGTLKSRRDERPQTGAQAPGNVATTEKAPRGRQRPKHVVIKHVIYFVAPSGLSFVNALVPGVLPFGQAQADNTPVCGLSRLDFVDLWFGAYLTDSNKIYMKIRKTTPYGKKYVYLSQ